MSCLVLVELVLRLLEVLLLEADLALLLGGLGGIVALLVLLQVELGQRQLDLGGDDVALALVALDFQSLAGWSRSWRSACLTLMSCWAMFLSISEESNLQTMSPFLTLVPSGTRLMILICWALTSQMPSTVTQLSRLPRSVTVIRKRGPARRRTAAVRRLREEPVQARTTP